MVSKLVPSRSISEENINRKTKATITRRIEELKLKQYYVNEAIEIKIEDV